MVLSLHKQIFVDIFHSQLCAGAFTEWIPSPNVIGAADNGGIGCSRTPPTHCMHELIVFSLHMSIVIQALKIESGFICLIALFFLVSLIPLSILLAWGCSTTTSTSHTNRSSPCRVDSSEDCGVPPSDSLQALDETISNALHCRRRLLQFLVQVVILMLM